MSDVSAAVRDLANALRATMTAGDQALAQSSIERKILQALVASAAADALQWVQTRVENGDVVGKPLAELTPALAEGDGIGGGLKAAREQSYQQAKSLAYSAVIGTATPAWVGSFVALVAGAFGFAQDAGTAFGAAIIPAVLGGGTALYVVFRGLAASPALLQATGAAAGSAWESAGSIGSSAEQIFRQHAGPAMSTLGDLGYRPASVSPVLTQLRGGARFILGATYALLTVCLLFFAFGMVNAFDAYSQQHSPCTVTRPDGTCIGS